MSKKKIKKISMVFLIAIVVYLGVGYLFHLVIFPEKKPAIATYFTPGLEFYSKSEGFRQTVHKQENGHVFCSLQLEPYAGGPPKHIHAGFDEFFEIENGELTVWIDGEIKKLHPGEKLLVPKGTAHKPYNETSDTIQVKGMIAFPEKFAFHLPQVYALMDKDAALASSPSAIFQMSLFTSEGFDSYVAEGPPVFIQKFISFLVAPLSRLIGYKSYYKDYDIRMCRNNA